MTKNVASKNNLALKKIDPRGDKCKEAQEVNDNHISSCQFLLATHIDNYFFWLTCKLKSKQVRKMLAIRYQYTISEITNKGCENRIKMFR